MSDVWSELADIVADVRAHVEYQKALGVRTIATASHVFPVSSSREAAVEKAVPAPRSESRYQSSQTAIAPGNGKSFAPRGPAALEEVREELGECARCKLHKARKTIVFGEGSPNAALVFVGEGPGSEEDRQGRPFVGEAGQLLTKIIENGIKLRRTDVYICNVVKCRPQSNRNPEPDEISACGRFLVKQLQAIMPKVIVTLGNIPTQTLLNTKEGITRLRGKWQTYEGIPLMPTFHPAYLLRNPRDKKLVWEDIQQVMEKLGLPVQPKESGARNQDSGENP